MDLAAVDLAQLLEKLESWLGAIVVMAPNVLLALLIVGAGAMGSRRLQRVVQSIVRRVTGNEPISRLLGKASRISAIVLACLWALALLHLDRTVTSLLAGVGVIGLALGFAFQDIAANFMSGFIMAMNRPFDVGDMVELAGRQCRVQHIHLRATEVETLDGLSIVVPNKDVFQNPIINYTRTAQRRMELTVGTAYSDDMEKVRSVVLEAVKDCPARDPDREIELFFIAFADSSINFQLRVWLDDSSQTAYEHARSQAMIDIKKAFDSHGITIPFPIRTLDFGARALTDDRQEGVRMKVVSGA